MAICRSEAWRYQGLGGKPSALVLTIELPASACDVFASPIGPDLAWLSSQSPLAIASALMLRSFHQATSLPA